MISHKLINKHMDPVPVQINKENTAKIDQFKPIKKENDCNRANAHRGLGYTARKRRKLLVAAEMKTEKFPSSISHDPHPAGLSTRERERGPSPNSWETLCAEAIVMIEKRLT